MGLRPPFPTLIIITSTPTIRTIDSITLNNNRPTVCAAAAAARRGSQACSRCVFVLCGILEGSGCGPQTGSTSQSIPNAGNTSLRLEASNVLAFHGGRSTLTPFTHPQTSTPTVAGSRATVARVACSAGAAQKQKQQQPQQQASRRDALQKGLMMAAGLVAWCVCACVSVYCRVRSCSGVQRSIDRQSPISQPPPFSPLLPPLKTGPPSPTPPAPPACRPRSRS